MVKNKEYYLNLPYKLRIRKEDSYFVANYEEYPKIIGVGESKAEAEAELKEAFECLIEDCLLCNETIKEPKAKEKKQRIPSIHFPENIFAKQKFITQDKKGNKYYCRAFKDETDKSKIHYLVSIVVDDKNSSVVDYRANEQKLCNALSHAK